MKTIVAVAGDYWHDGAAIEEALRAALKTELASESVKLSVIPAELLADALKDAPDAVVLYKEGKVNPTAPEPVEWMTEAVEEAIERYVSEGGKWVAWHSGLAGYRAESAYYKLLKGYFEYHPNEHQVVTYTALSEALDGTYSAPDEHYFVACDTEHTNVFLRAESVDGESPAGWRHSHGAGTVVCYTPGHTSASLMDETQLGWLRAVIVG
ncbi:ThuA domain-containing protein [Paenibacillus thermotolerans]|uniref:ThuA domain-containing protein n=1 Tax=Paenibacillus thermotolerans TaxID=3027807 RepID=UPI002368F172|nr:MULTISPECIES: ThuA domain-containing protein [unclassified Paenibacillus]